MSTITTRDGVEIFYKDWGRGQPVVFSHGWPLSSDDWDAQMLFFLGQGFRVVAHDRRGHGRSSQVAACRCWKKLMVRFVVEGLPAWYRTASRAPTRSLRGAHTRTSPGTGTESHCSHACDECARWLGISLLVRRARLYTTLRTPHARATARS